ncbi:hypothetical protein ES332_A12G171500v1 [Gossypium tomentosum]|uniref:C2 NT-type domain-containing protein n=1 Tax=Gossypium tomentosum TaxID=34277 RepID=A0A5D2MYI5_GOSTO|nr:hypothetical protein ES332_A12G171500v1 [Gossypium tomentosum]
MVLGLRTKNRKGCLHQLVYTVNVKEINPWTPLQSLRSAQSVLLQWETGDKSSGSIASTIDNGKIAFNESFKLPLTLRKEASRKSTNHLSFHKNCLEFYLYVSRKENVSKAQLLGSAIVNLADYGIIKEAISISAPFNLKKSSRNIEHPVLYLNIQPFDKDSSSALSKEVSLDKDGSECVSEFINEGNDEEIEIASFTDDDVDDLSSRSSHITSSSSSVFDHSRESHIQHDKNKSESATGGFERLGLTLPSAGTHVNSGVSPIVEVFKQVNGNTSPSSSVDLCSNSMNPVTNPMAIVASPEHGATTIPVETNLDRVKDEDLSYNPKNLVTYPKADVASSETSVTIPVNTNLEYVKGKGLSNNPKNPVSYPMAKVESAETSVTTPVDTNLDHVTDNGLPNSPKNPVTSPMAKVTSTETSITIPVDMNFDHVEDSHAKREGDRKALRHDRSHVDRSLSRISHVGQRKENEEKTLWEDELDSQILNAKEYSPRDMLSFIQTQDSTKNKITWRSNTFASSCETTEVKGGFIANDGQKHVAPVQLHFDNNGLSKKIQFMEKEKEHDISEEISNGNSSDMLSEREETVNNFSNSKFNSGNSYGPLKNTKFMEKAKESDIPEEIHNGSTKDTCNESEEDSNSFSNSKVELESKIEMLEQELREAAVVEASLYSVIAEHGGSINKVHAPARRLSRFYIHACRTSNPDKRANAARAAVSGLVLVSKACGNDVPRLTFWLSNSIVLRAIVSNAIGGIQLYSGPCLNSSSEGMVLEDNSYLQEECNSTESFEEWVDPRTFLLALEKFETWIFSRIIESVWWQTLTPHMQSAAAKSSSSRKTSTKSYELGDEEQGNFSVKLWEKAFKDACERLCPIRACGHECGCLSMLAKLVMEQLVGRLDVAMFNAILRESVDEMPTDPVSDPICDSKVLPIPAGKSSFWAGVQLKNAIGNWSRWLTDLFGIDDNDGLEDSNEVDDDKKAGFEASFKAFGLLNALSDLMMLPSDMLVNRSLRKEVCPKFSPRLIIKVLNNFVPDEFNPNLVSEAVFESLDENISEVGDKSITNFPCMAAPTVYSPPSAASLTGIVGEVGSQALRRSRSVLRKSYTSDDELDELDSPITSIIIENRSDSTHSKSLNWMRMGKGERKVSRYQLIREIWKEGEW